MIGMNNVLLVGALIAPPRTAPTNFPLVNLKLGLTPLLIRDGALVPTAQYPDVSVAGKPAEWLSEKALDTGALVVARASIYSPQGRPPEIRASRVEVLNLTSEMVTDAKGQQRAGPDVSVNSVTLIGNVATEPKTEETEHGPVQSFGLVMNDSYSKGGEEKTSSHYVQVNAWRGAARPLEKGQPVMVIGSVKPDKPREVDGKNVNSVSVVAHTVCPMVGNRR